MYNKTIIEFGFRMIIIMNYQNLVSVLSAEAEKPLFFFDAVIG